MDQLPGDPRITGQSFLFPAVDCRMAELTQHTIDTPYLVGAVHCYSGEVAGELALFDTGPPTPEGRDYLQKNVDLNRLRHVFVTHCHIDHYGQAAWLEENSEATIYLPRRDCLKIERHEQRIDGMYRLLKDYGFSRTYLEELQEIFHSGALFPTFPKRYKIAERDIPQRLGLQVIPCPGHSQSDLVYADGATAVTGDTLLRGIFQCPLLDIDLETGERFNNYQAYCKTLLRLGSLEGKTILPGHREWVRSVLDTVLFYVSKLLVRVEQILPYRNENDIPKLVDLLLEGRVRDVFHVYLKGAEILFMKDFLAHPELLHDSLVELSLFDSVSELFHRAVGENPV